jgi:hypothetical protein
VTFSNDNNQYELEGDVQKHNRQKTEDKYAITVDYCYSDGWPACGVGLALAAALGFTACKM